MASNNEYVGYIRVSTAKQGEGVSLQQQREAIDRYAQRNHLDIRQWFEEQETAAKQGRREFGSMVKLLRRGAARGVIIHKIDRSARNLRDWADLGDLIDRGIEVHFANEALDLTSRGGRLSADIQAVVAADYIRNLREETKKGFYGRLQQGFFPMPAPLGYLNHGKALSKTPDPTLAPLVRRAFELYSTGRFNLANLSSEMFQLGLRRKGNRPLRRTTLSHMLNNSFYYGLIRIKKTGQVFTGNHKPLISRSLFERVQAVLKGKLSTRSQRHDFLFRRRLTCRSCGYSLIGETHKGFIYYRCYMSSCPTTCVREETVEEAVLSELRKLRLSEDERRFLKQELGRIAVDGQAAKMDAVRSLDLRLRQLDDRLGRLTDAYIDRLLERQLFEERKKALLSERVDLESQLSNWQGGRRNPAQELSDYLERADSAYLAYKQALPSEKRDLVDTLTSNRMVGGKNVVVMLSLPFSEIAKRAECQDGSATENRTPINGLKSHCPNH